MKHEGVDMWD